MERPASYAPAEAIESADSAEADFDFDGFLNEAGVDLEARDATLAELEALYGGRVFRYGQYSGTVADMAASCPAFSDILEQGVGAAANWLESNDEPEAAEDEAEENEQAVDKVEAASDEERKSHESQQDSRDVKRSVEDQEPADDKVWAIADVFENSEHVNAKAEGEIPDARAHGETATGALLVDQQILQQNAPVASSELVTAETQAISEYGAALQSVTEQSQPIASIDSHESHVEVEPKTGEMSNNRVAEVNNKVVQMTEADNYAEITDNATVVAEATVEQFVVMDESVDRTESIIENTYTIGTVKTLSDDLGRDIDAYEASMIQSQHQDHSSNIPEAAVNETPLDEVDFWQGSADTQDLNRAVWSSEEIVMALDDEAIDDTYENNNFTPDLMGEQGTDAPEVGDVMSEFVESIQPVSQEVTDIIVDLTGQAPHELPEVRTIELYTQANATVRAIEALEKSRSAEDCRESLELLREELEILLQQLGYADAQAMAERLTQHYDIASLKKYIMLLTRTFLLEQMKDEKPQTLSTSLDVPYHRYGAQAVRMVVDFAKSSAGYQSAAA